MRVPCWKCKKELDLEGKIPFRAVCDHCGAWLHVCKNCRHHDVGRHNQCRIPDTPLISDREGANYCEDFALQLSDTTPSPGQSRAEIEKRLFGD